MNTQKEIDRINPADLVDTSMFGFSQVVSAPSSFRRVYISGQFSGDLQGNVLGKTTAEQAKIVFDNLRKAILAADAKPEHAVKITVLVVDHDQSKLASIQEGVEGLFGEHLPASTLIPVPRLALDEMLIEVDVTLEVPTSGN